MKLLFDQNLSFRLCSDLSDLFSGSQHVRLAGLETASDRQIWEYAAANDFVIVTQDSDFAELAAFHGAPPKVIWIRTGNQPREKIEALFRARADVVAAFAHEEAVCLELY